MVDEPDQSVLLSVQIVITIMINIHFIIGCHEFMKRGRERRK